MKTIKTLALLLAIMLTGCATDPAKRQAIAGQSADVMSTAGALAMGAAEANPLGIAILPLKVILTKSAMEEKDDCKRAGRLNALAGFGYGPAANNICIMAVIATGGAGAAICPIIGVATFFGVVMSNAPDVRATCARVKEEEEARERWPDPDPETAGQSLEVAHE